MTTDTSIEKLIDKLSEELKPCKPACPYRRISFWFVLSIAYLIGFISYLGLRHDVSERFVDSVFLFEIGMGIALFVTSALASSFLSFPDCHQKNWTKIVPITLLASMVLWVVARSIEEGMGLMTTAQLGHCVGEGLFLEILPVVALIFITMRGHTTQPYWSMLMNILAVSALGWVGLRFTCSMDVMGHTLFNHVMPFAILGAGLGFLARKLFKW